MAFYTLPPELQTAVAEQVVLLTSRSGLALEQETRLSCVSFAAMASVCRATCDALRAADLFEEVACRRKTLAAPQDWDTRLPFTAQFAHEQQTRKLLRALNAGIASLGTHCASTHCLAARKCLNRDHLACRTEVAHACARQIALAGDRAFLYCTGDEKGSTARWIVAADMRGGTVWSPKSELRREARVDVEDTVLAMAAGGSLLLFSTQLDVWAWRPPAAPWRIYTPVYGFCVGDFWVARGEPRLLLHTAQNDARQIQQWTEADTRCMVGHFAGDRVTRFSNEEAGVHSALRPSADGSVALCVTARATGRAVVQLLDTEEDVQEVLSHETTRGQIVALCLAPSAQSACVFTLGIGLHLVWVEVFLRLAKNSWTRASSIAVPGQPSAFGASWPLPAKNDTEAVYSSCGSRVLFHGPRLTPRPAICSLRLSGLAGTRPERVHVKNCAHEAIPREIVFSAAGVLMRTHRGALVIRESPA